MKIHSRDHIENSTQVARGERLYQQLHGDVREFLGQRLMFVERALDTQDVRVIEPVLREFRRLPDEIERQGPLPTD